MPFHALSSEAMDVAGFCERYWEPVAPTDGHPGHSGLRSAVGGGSLPATIATDLVELHAALHLSDVRYRAASGTSDGLLHEARRSRKS